MSKRVREHIYTVRGTGVFPSDMLRYDDARANTPEDQVEIDMEMTRENREHMRGREIRLVGSLPPTEGRWHSFMWIVVRGSHQQYWVEK